MRLLGLPVSEIQSVNGVCVDAASGSREVSGISTLLLLPL